LIHWKHLVLAHTKQQLRPRLQCPLPEWVAHKAAVRDDQHGFVGVIEYLMRQRLLSRGIGADFGADQHLRAAFGERAKAHLGKGGSTPRGARIAKVVCIGGFVGHLQRAAVETHDAQTLVPDTCHALGTHRHNLAAVQRLEGLDSHARARQ
jgi:hypothetical protein